MQAQRTPLRSVVKPCAGVLLLVAALASPAAARTLKLSLPGLEQPVKVLTDELGVPHIYARSDHDLYFAQGYAHARDRFFQMDANRRAASGTLAELTGDFTHLANDARARVMGFRLAAQRSLDLLEPREAAVLEAYVDGVNAWLVSSPLPPEYQELEVTSVPPWTSLDTLALAKARGASEDARLYQIDETRLVERYVAVLGEEAGLALYEEDLNRDAPMLPGATVPDALGSTLVSALPKAPRESRSAPGPTAARFRVGAQHGGLVTGAPRRELGVGSNVWGVAASASRTGRPLLAQDGHGMLTIPSLDYENHLVVRNDPAAGPMDVTGVTSAGIPGVLLGMNRFIAWGSTLLFTDLSDVFRDRLIRDDPGCPVRLCIQSAGGLHPVEERFESYRMNQIDGTPDNSIDVTAGVAALPGGERAVHVLTVPFRSFGPVLELEDPSVVNGGTASETTALTLQYTGLEGTREPKYLLAAQRARDVFEFRDALRSLTAGAQSFVVADVAGHLAYFASGEVPLRADLEAGALAGPPPWLIRDGSGPANWIPDPGRSQGQVLPFSVVPFDEMPQVVDPPAGIVVNCNEDPSGFALDNDVLNQTRPSKPSAIHYLGDTFIPGLRNARITRLLREKIGAGEKLSLEDMKRLQADTHQVDAELLLPYLLAAFGAATGAGAPPELAAFASDARIAEAMGRLAAWDFSTPTGIPEGYDASDRDGERERVVSDGEAAHSVAATLYNAWRGELLHSQIDGTLADLGLQPVWETGNLMAMHWLLSQEPFTGVGASGVDFFPEPAALGAEDRRDAVLLRALRDALDALASNAYAAAFGRSTSQSDYRWGRLNRVQLAHNLGAGSSVPPAGGFAALSPELPGLARDGGYQTVNTLGADPTADRPRDFLSSFASLRRIVSSPLGRSRALGFGSLPGGSSGDPASPLYISQLGSWLTADYHEMETSKRKLRRRARTKEWLVPAP